jgi:membrane protein
VLHWHITPLFSLASLLVIVIFITGFVYRGDAVGHIERQVVSLVGAEAAKTIAVAIHNAGTFGHGIIATIVSFVVLSLGAIGVFSELHITMNKIWKVRRRENGFIFGVVKDEFVSFTMVLAIALLLLVSVILSAVLSAITAYFQLSPTWAGLPLARWKPGRFFRCRDIFICSGFPIRAR